MLSSYISREMRERIEVARREQFSTFPPHDMLASCHGFHSTIKRFLENELSYRQTYPTPSTDMSLYKETFWIK